MLSTDLSMAAAVGAAELVHSHTWYTNLAGHLAARLYAVPHVMTAHSLEPLRPWKAEQLGGGYAVSCWVERTAIESADAVIAVSAGMRADILTTYPAVHPARVHVLHNGVDTDAYRPDPRTDALSRFGIDPDRPFVLFVGRITQQKGLPHLLAAAHRLRVDAQLVLCAGAADTADLGARVAAEVSELRRERSGVVWIEQVLPRDDIVQLMSHATVFVCPSVYEPLGIVNLEAMACETAVVASAVGGIPEVVADGESGLARWLRRNGSACVRSGTCRRDQQPARRPGRAAAMGAAGRDRAIAHFGWDAIAATTVEIYRSALS